MLKKISQSKLDTATNTTSIHIIGVQGEKYIRARGRLIEILNNCNRAVVRIDKVYYRVDSSIKEGSVIDLPHYCLYVYVRAGVESSDYRIKTLDKYDIGAVILTQNGQMLTVKSFDPNDLITSCKDNRGQVIEINSVEPVEIIARDYELCNYLVNNRYTSD